MPKKPSPTVLLADRLIQELTAAHRRLFAAQELAALLTPTVNRDALAAALLHAFYWECVDRDALAAKDGEEQQAFMDVLRNYAGELADVLAHALGSGRSPAAVLDELFADTRPRVDVTFPVGPAGEQLVWRGTSMTEPPHGVRVIEQHLRLREAHHRALRQFGETVAAIRLVQPGAVGAAFDQRAQCLHRVGFFFTQVAAVEPRAPTPLVAGVRGLGTHATADPVH